jgi:hypothetical protein
METFSDVFARLFVVGEWNRLTAAAELQAALRLAQQSGDSHDDIVYDMRYELQYIKRRQQGYLLYGLTWEKEDRMMWIQFHDQLNRPWLRMRQSLMSASISSTSEWLHELAERLAETMDREWQLSIHAARKELHAQMEARHCDRQTARSQEFLPRLCMHRTSDSVDVGEQMYRELPWAWL